jgi:hypothetical protein
LLEESDAHVTGQENIRAAIVSREKRYSMLCVSGVCGGNVLREVYQSFVADLGREIAVGAYSKKIEHGTGRNPNVLAH